MNITNITNIQKAVHRLCLDGLVLETRTNREVGFVYDDCEKHRLLNFKAGSRPFERQITRHFYH